MNNKYIYIYLRQESLFTNHLPENGPPPPSPGKFDDVVLFLLALDGEVGAVVLDAGGREITLLAYKSLLLNRPDRRKEFTQSFDHCRQFHEFNP